MMKNKKNKQNLVALWTYECVWIDIEMDPQSQMKFKGVSRRMEFRVCRRVKCHYLKNDEYKLVEHEDKYPRY
jgi:hypothetical protein